MPIIDHRTLKHVTGPHFPVRPQRVGMDGQSHPIHPATPHQLSKPLEYLSHPLTRHKLPPLLLPLDELVPQHEELLVPLADISDLANV